MLKSDSRGKKASAHSPRTGLMSIKSIIPSMFHRRLLLVLSLMLVAFIPLGVRLARLTLGRGEDLRAQAESRLTRSQQTPTVRGSIVDRKGRILAQDRPSYDIAVEYQVINGDWAREQARLAARRSVGSAWTGLSPQTRDDEAARYLPAFLVHLDRAWDEIASRSGIPRVALDQARDRTIQLVESKAQHLAKARRERELALAAEKGVKLTEASLKAIERKANQPIAEMRQAHVLVSRVSDDAGFACQGLAGEEVELALPAPEDRLNDARSARTVTVDRAPGLMVRDSGDREYPFETLIVSVDRSTFPGPLRSDAPAEVTVPGIASHLIGRMRDQIYGSVGAEASPTGQQFVGDPERRQAFLDESPEARARAYALLGVDRGSYRDGDRVGDGGIESTQENLLRGLRGVQTNRLDTGERITEPPVRGRDVHLTLDVMLQARVQALMTPAAGLAVVHPWHHQESTTQALGAPLYGAAVVLDIDSGDILAMVSTPSYTQADLRDRRDELVADKLSTPLLNRATQKFYTPGSIVKPLMLVGARQRRAYSLDEPIACTGHLFENQPNIFRCWIYKKFQTTHTALYGHPLTPDEAIMCSCNVFFFTMGRRLGPEGVIATYREFGVGSTFDLGAGYEVPGAMGFRKDAADLGLKLPDAIQMGIGQGPVTWTPLHAANAYATLARRGIWQSPRLITGLPRPEPRDLGLDASSIDVAIRGLQRSVNDHEGTGNHIVTDGIEEPIFNFKSVDVWGKTGTAAAPKLFNDPDGRDGPAPPELLEEGDHSWFVVMVGHGAPKYVISCVIDYGGSGGKVSGPIVNQIIHALELEGYL